MKTIRYSSDAKICLVDDDGEFRVAKQCDMDTLPCGDDLTEEEIEDLGLNGE